MKAESGTQVSDPSMSMSSGLQNLKLVQVPKLGVADGITPTSTCNWSIIFKCVMEKHY